MKHLKPDMITQTVAPKEEIPVEILCRQKSIFSVITLLVVAVLLVMHTIFASILGWPSVIVVVLLGVALVLSFAEWVWLRNRGQKLTERAVKIESGTSIAVAF